MNLLYSRKYSFALLFAILSGLALIGACNSAASDKESKTSSDSSAVETTTAPADTLANDNTNTTSTDTAVAVIETPITTNTTIPAPPPSGIKYGYLNSLELLAKMPETKAADKQLEEFAKGKEASFNTLAQKYQTEMQQLQQKAQDMTRVEQEAKMKEMAEMEERLQAMQMNSQAEVAAKKEELYAPILAKADKYIKQVGKENGYVFIYDAAALLYADTSLNILPLVKRKMKMK